MLLCHQPQETFFFSRKFFAGVITAVCAYLVIGPRLARRKARGRRWNDAVPCDVRPGAARQRWDRFDYGNQRVSVASFFDGCLMTLVDEVERTGSKLVHSSGSRSVYTLLHQH